MPVLKQKISVQDTRTINAVSAGNGPRFSGFGELLKVGAGALAQQAESYGRAFAAENQQKAEMLAKQATFSTSINGAPEIPEQNKYEMGRLAKATYDATMNDRFVTQLGFAIDNQINESANANMYDMTQFGSDVEVRLATLVQDVPEEFKGAFQQIAADKFVSKSAQIGYTQAKLQQENDATMMPHMVDSWQNQIDKHIILGTPENDDHAKYLIEYSIDKINSTPDHIASQGQKEQYIRNIHQRAGISRASRDLDLDSRTASQLLALYNEVIDPSTEETTNLLTEYFPDYNVMGIEPDGVFRKEAANAFGSHIQKLMQAAYARDTAEKTAITNRTEAWKVEKGLVPKNVKNQAILNTIIEEQLAAILVSGNKPMELTAELWLNGFFDNHPQARADAIAQAKTSGYLPSSLKEAFQRVKNTNSVEEMSNIFTTFRDLQESTNLEGKQYDFSDEIFDGTREIYQLATDLVGDGQITDVSVERAMAMWSQTRDADWNNELFFKQIEKDFNLNDSFFNWTNTVTSENFKQEITKRVSQELENQYGETPVQAELDTASRLFEAYLRANQFNKDGRNDSEAAMHFAIQNMNGRYVSTEYSSEYARSANAPEKYYSEPMANGVIELITRFSQDAGSAIFKGLEWLNPRKLWPGDLPEEFHLDYGSDAMGIDPFKAMANQKIQDHLRSTGQMDQFGHGWETLMPGRDYRLIYNPETGSPPTYFVQMINTGGNGEAIQLPDFVLDVREDWKKMKTFNATYAIAEQRAKDEFSRQIQETRENRTTMEMTMEEILAEELRKLNEE